MEVLAYTLTVVMFVALIITKNSSAQKIRNIEAKIEQIASQKLDNYIDSMNDDEDGLSHATTLEEGCLYCMGKNKTTRHILTTLFGAESPMLYEKLKEVIRAQFTPDKFSETGLKSTIKILMGGNFIRETMEGFSIMPLGKELCARICKVRPR